MSSFIPSSECSTTFNFLKEEAGLSRRLKRHIIILPRLDQFEVQAISALVKTSRSHPHGSLATAILPRSGGKKNKNHSRRPPPHPARPRALQLTPSPPPLHLPSPFATRFSSPAPPNSSLPMTKTPKPKVSPRLLLGKKPDEYEWTRDGVPPLRSRVPARGKSETEWGDFWIFAGAKPAKTYLGKKPDEYEW
eukprot:CAMPEP_0174914282 /NCGR_PEP_ID=MMETSP0167-20121228/80758_1 /TAXON_ID=38298 /ORGANISM="Rhodella maculata, Strain CCMP736" /LENGTH=191 /DNA_ID=CAMNT_0016159035 /DNA_START=259 /DNA_END=831 /DNA_ORIENTATION=-